MQPRVWLFTEVYFPEQTSTGFLLTRIAEGIAEKFDVAVLAGPAANFFHSVEAPTEEMRNGVRILRCKGTNFDKDRLALRLINALTRSMTIFWLGLRRCRKGDVLLVVTNPPTLPVFAACVAGFRRCKLALIVHDVYPEALFASGILRPGSFAGTILQWFNGAVYRRCQKVVTLGRDMDALVERTRAVRAERIARIPNWADLELVAPDNRAQNPLLRELGLLGKFVILYAGNMGRTHDIEGLAGAAIRLKHDPRFHFLVIGFGAKRAWLEQYKRQQGLDNVTLLDPQPRSKQQVFLNACDLALISFVMDMCGVSVPSRMYNQMAAGKPIVAVADAASELARVVAEERIGWVLPPGDPDALVETLKGAIETPRTLAEMGQRAAAAARERYSFEVVKAAYQNLIGEILAN